MPDSHTLDNFTKLNPENNASTSLDLWNKFEIQNPDTFRRMYKFWVQKI